MRRITRIVIGVAAATALVTAGSPALALGTGGVVHGGSASGEPAAADSYVAQWDAIGSQAFTAAALSPAEGHVIFSYVAVAVYDAVMAVHPDYELRRLRTAYQAAALLAEKGLRRGGGGLVPGDEPAVG